jgi:hypothetical protein
MRSGRSCGCGCGARVRGGIARLSLVDRKTVKRYVAAGTEVGLVRYGDEGQLSDGLIGQVCERVRAHRPDGHGVGWEALRACHEQLEAWLFDEHLTVVKAHELLAARASRSRGLACTDTHWRFWGWVVRPGPARWNR